MTEKKGNLVMSTLVEHYNVPESVLLELLVLLASINTLKPVQDVRVSGVNWEDYYAYVVEHQYLVQSGRYLCALAQKAGLTPSRALEIILAQELDRVCRHAQICSGKATLLQIERARNLIV